VVVAARFACTRLNRGAVTAILGVLTGLRILLPVRKATVSAQPDAHGGEQDSEDDPRDFHHQVIADHGVLPGCQGSC